MSDYPKLGDFGAKLTLVRRHPYVDDPAWSAFNPSVMKSNENEYWMAFRSSNYVITQKGVPALTAESKIRNKLYLVKLNPENWQFIENTLTEIDTKSIRNDIKRNVEDPRLFWDGENYCISATFLERTVPTARVCKITLKSLEKPEITDLEVFPSPKNQIEKNWMPIFGTKHYIYKPEYLLKDGVLEQLSSPAVTKLFRGGTQIIPIDEKNSIGLIHELYYKIYPIMNPATFAPYQSIRHYTHRFVKYNEKYEITHLSPKFVFIKNGIEFAAGLTKHENDYIISFGRSDISAYIATINKQKVLDMLEEVNG